MDTARKMFRQLFTHHLDLYGLAYGFVEGAYNVKRMLPHGGGTVLFDTGLYLLSEKGAGILSGDFLQFSPGGKGFGELPCEPTTR